MRKIPEIPWRASCMNTSGCSSRESCSAAGYNIVWRNYKKSKVIRRRKRRNTSRLQQRLHEILKEKNDFKRRSSLMERKVDQLTKENGSLSFQLRGAHSLLDSYEAKVGQLTAALECAQGEWETQKNHLQSEVKKATTEKEILSEQNRSLEGKISMLQDEISTISRGEVGENMYAVAEEMMEDEKRWGSTIHAKATSTFCVGEETGPETGPEDWKRIEELQARNKACLPPLKSSDPIEFETPRAGAFVVTHDAIPTGSLSDTIHRASMTPGQLPDSCGSHRHMFSTSVNSPRTAKRLRSTLFKPLPEKGARAGWCPVSPKNRTGKKRVSDAAVAPADQKKFASFFIENSQRKNKLLKRSSRERQGE
ncbi:nuclear mitotic apparatus protein 1-like isoform X2 [Synchiropus splendidus]|uniref:nuclear mitotic apparatus protein 1-like isoform X2 n=1 Tax=Synchiropus splendidus TaxID=270530 RepID=UPI00237EC6A4|nr:nuclear mitotic apparatus protein 1-like isoform X2 [Synchiropus splendidus]XP_053729684.1 nuclear mitotic apparatus protein 1-like isoform X2 [Synchiropus splendidus]XP_053729685.1 nuclear mitotic apparatus protein 1-like isoform X2 [Synchiropus splendidus]XP_053729686.1 nuclear mitotic apparatus protein 1-like isoform X2 [Synchiropus splendidus]